MNAAQTLAASDGAAKDQFGYSVAISGGVAAVGAPFKTSGGFTGAGQAYIFTANLAGAFAQSKILTATTPARTSTMAGRSPPSMMRRRARPGLRRCPDADNVKGQQGRRGRRVDRRVGGVDPSDDAPTARNRRHSRRSIPSATASTSRPVAPSSGLPVRTRLASRMPVRRTPSYAPPGPASPPGRPTV